MNPLSPNFFVYKLIELFGDLLKRLFIPSQDSFSAIYNTFHEKLGFVDTIKEYGGEIKTRLLEMNSGKARSYPKLTYNFKSSFYTGTVTIFDCAWFINIKPYTDLIISGFCYLLFFWRLYKRLPAIVSGVVLPERGDD